MGAPPLEIADMGKADNISVVVSTYNAPGRLLLVLHALARQTILPAEVILADAGSSAAGDLAANASQMPFSITHTWQPDEGFRAARARNNAIHNARGDIIAMLDQDTLPHHTWLLPACFSWRHQWLWQPALRSPSKLRRYLCDQGDAGRKRLRVQHIPWRQPG